MEQVEEEVSIYSKNNNKLDQQSHVIKRKRTKRQRPQSPIPFLNNINPNDKNVSPAAASSEEEDELDMVNCLILLSQCHSRKSPKQAHYDHQQETAQIDQIHNHNTKFISRKFLETPSSGSGLGSSSGTGNGGYYVYECKTCYKMFPSFQALGGHRASHKKPNIRKVSSLSLQLRNNYNNDNNRGGNRNLYSPSSCNNMKSKRVHECSVCGAEFLSGQALGGHMRRHRAAAPVLAAAAPTMSNRTLSLSPMEVEMEVEEPRKSRNNMLYLDLDLNLPAPEDDMIRESKLPLSPKQQQQQQQQKSCLVFSAAPTLVDCHY